MEKLKKGLFFAIFLLGICACGKDMKNDPAAIPIDMGEIYLSVTETSWDNGVDSSGGMTTAEYVCGLTGEETYKVGSVAYTSQYPLAVYDRGDNVLYYTADDRNGSGGDELCCKVLDTGECYQLTDGLFAINYIIPTQDYIILIAVDFHERNLTPYRYEKATGKLSKILVYQDFSVQKYGYDLATQRLFLGGFLESEDYKKVSEFNEYLLEVGLSTEDVEFTPADGYIFELTDEYMIPSQILKVEGQGIEKGVGVGADGKLYLQLSFTSRMARLDPVTQSWVLDPETGEFYQSDDFAKLPIYVSSYTKYGEDYYILGVSLEDDGATYPRAVYRYRPGNSELKMIYVPSGNGFINQFRICKDIGKTNLLLKEEWRIDFGADIKNDRELSGNTVRKQIDEMTVNVPDENGFVETKLIPDRMQPGSRIYFMDDNHFIILVGGIYYDTEEKVNERKKEWLEQVERAEAAGVTVLPNSAPKKGTYVDYGSDGYAHRIYDGLTLEEAEEKATGGQEQAKPPTTTPVPIPTKTPSCTPSPVPSPISPEPTLPPLDITLVDEKLPWDDKALPETDHVYIVRFIPTDRDDLLVAYDVCVDIKWDINDFYDDKKRPKNLHTWWLREDAFCFVSASTCPIRYNKTTVPDYIAQDISRWEDVEEGMYSISHDLFRWMIKWYEINWWCGVKDGEIVYVRQHLEG